MPALPDDLVTALSAAGFTPLIITMRHAAAAGALPLHHRDPLDRLLIAQALLDDLPVATADAAFATYGCRVVWR